MTNFAEMNRKELVAAAKGIGIVKAQSTKSVDLIAALEAHEAAKNENNVADENQKETSGGKELVCVIRRWTKENGKWADEGFTTAMFVNETRSNIIRRFRDESRAEIWNSPVALFSRKDYKKFLAGEEKANKGLDSEFVRAEVGVHFQ